MKEGVPSSVHKEQVREPKNEKTPWRLRASNHAFIDAYVSRVEPHGLDVLDRIPPDKKKIIAATHISDFDMPIALDALGSRLDLLIGDMARFHNPLHDLPGFATRVLTGTKNFSGIDFKLDKSGGIFNPDNFEKMKAVMDQTGKTPLIAAHNPSEGAQLPDKGGYGAVYLASLLDNAVLVPVAVSLRSDKVSGLSSDYAAMRKERPMADVSAGEPIELPKITGASMLGELMKKRSSGEALLPEEKEKLHAILQQLREESGEVMKRLADLLPENKRGTWGESHDID